MFKVLRDLELAVRGVSASARGLNDSLGNEVDASKPMNKEGGFDDHNSCLGSTSFFPKHMTHVARLAMSSSHSVRKTLHKTGQ